MAIRYKTRAFVFKKNNINESDRVFSVFTDNFGRLDIFAKAIRKTASKLRSGIDIFFMSEIEFIQGKSKKTLTDAVIIEKFDNITQDLEKFKIANRIGEILDNFIKGEEKDENIFNLINETFIKLNNYQFSFDASGRIPRRVLSNYQLLYYYFLWNVLSLLGYRPEVEKCASCHEKLIPYNISFSSKEGGIICKKCLTSGFKQKIYPVKSAPQSGAVSREAGQFNRVNSDIVKILRIILSKDWQTLSKLKIEPSSQKLFEEISEGYYLYILSSHSFK